MSIYICNILIAIVAKLSLDIVTFDRWVGERPLCDDFSSTGIFNLGVVEGYSFLLASSP
jgi:hypothetical protein